MEEQNVVTAPEAVAETGDIYKASRLLYVIEAALEYFVSILATGAYLAKLTSAIGLSDGLTGILSAFVSLGCGFQIVAIFLANKRPVKRWITALHIVNQAFFALVYFVPFLKGSKLVKTVCFVVLLLLAHIINNIVYSPKMNWLMSLVDEGKRGSFTATKETVSLIGGMVFSFVVGLAIDGYEAAGELNKAFLFCGVGLFVLMLLHTCTLIFCKEKPAAETEKASTKQMLSGLLKDKNLFKVILVSVLWNVANYVSTPFYGTYQTQELGFSMKFVSLLAAAYAVVRSLVSKPLGKFADKYSFCDMLNICFTVAAIGFLINVFTVPSNGKIVYTIYYVFYAIAMGGINSAAINLIYDYTDRERRVGALAIRGLFAGFAGFFTTLAVSPLVDYIQAQDNRFLGMDVYAQQVLSAISFLLVAVVLVYNNLVLKKVKSNRD